MDTKQEEAKEHQEQPYLSNEMKSQKGLHTKSLSDSERIENIRRSKTGLEVDDT